MRLFSILIILFEISISSVYAQMVLKNPILAGFYADPSICKVGQDYFLINSTFSYFPGIPIFQSKDLKNWKQIGNVIDRPEQMDFMGQGLSKGLFAPAINYHNGTYYVTCTNIGKGGNFIVTSKDPAGPWSNPIYLKEVIGIDPSLFFDGDSAYIVYNSEPPEYKSLYSGHRTIRIYKLDLATLKVKGEETILVNGGVDINAKPVWIEGPHIYKRGEFYYLMAAEGGTGENHSEVVFRSANVIGPYIPYPKNPILTQRNLDPNRKNPIGSVGHADLVEGPDGNTYAVFLGVRPYEDDYYNTGRETFIAPVRWIDGWPIINPDQKEIQYNYEVDWKEFPQKNNIPFSGNFDFKVKFKDTINSRFQFLRTNNSPWYSLEKKTGLNMKLLSETMFDKGNPAFLGVRQQHLTSSATVELCFSTKRSNEKSGLIVVQNENHFYYLCKSSIQNKDVIQLYKSKIDTNQMVLLEQIELQKNQDKIYLKIKADKTFYSFWYATQKDKWSLLKNQVDAKFLSTKIAGGFIGVFFGLFVTSEGSPSTNNASYKWLEYHGNDVTFK